jgi:hypothetical protein
VLQAEFNLYKAAEPDISYREDVALRKFGLTSRETKL